MNLFDNLDPGNLANIMSNPYFYKVLATIIGACVVMWIIKNPVLRAILFTLIAAFCVAKFAGIL